jgi:hypothetical protein
MAAAAWFVVTPLAVLGFLMFWPVAFMALAVLLVVLGTFGAVGAGLRAVVRRRGRVGG